MTFFFDESCSPDKPYIKSFAVEEYVDGWGGAGLYVVLSDGKNEEIILLGDRSLSQETLACLVDRAYFSAEYPSQIEDDCLSQKNSAN